MLHWDTSLDYLKFSLAVVAATDYQGVILNHNIYHNKFTVSLQCIVSTSDHL